MSSSLSAIAEVGWWLLPLGITACAVLQAPAPPALSSLLLSLLRHFPHFVHPSQDAGTSAQGDSKGPFKDSASVVDGRSRETLASLVGFLDQSVPLPAKRESIDSKDVKAHSQEVGEGVTPSRPDSLESLFNEISSSKIDAQNHESLFFSDESDGEGERDVSPPRRLSSMGEIQMRMGISLKGRNERQKEYRKASQSFQHIDMDLPVTQLKDVTYLAQGAMCAAYKVMHNSRWRVLKTVLPDTSHTTIAANDLEVEMVLLRELKHKGIVGLCGAGYLPDKRRFLLLEYLPGGTLADRLREARSGAPMPLSMVLDLAIQLTSAGQYLHDAAVPGRIVLHRDLKPDNIGFSKSGDLKLLDFGLGKVIKRKYRVRSCTYAMTGGTGSLRYMAPEVANHAEYNEAADVYSFSLIFWEMLSNCKPFAGLKRDEFYRRVVDKHERPPINRLWSPAVQNILVKCWDHKIEERMSFREINAILQVTAEDENRRRHEKEAGYESRYEISQLDGMQRGRQSADNEDAP
ncbi:unnamed protein product, partial [Chrysoparadoxa australica]